MKEKIMLLFWILFLGSGIYVLSTHSDPQQYNYNGWIFKSVYAAVAPDSASVYKTNPSWNKTLNKVMVDVSSNSVHGVTVKSVYVPPPPRDSH